MKPSMPIGLDIYQSDAQLKSVVLFVGYPDALLKFISACCVIFTVIGVPGNLITVIALTRYKKTQNATAIFITNLSVSDLLFCALVLPVMVSTFWTHSWVHGKAVCRLLPFVNYTVIMVSMYSVVAIAINRYVLICHPMHYHRLYTKMNICIMLITLWSCALGIISLPFFELWGQMSLDPEVNWCTIIPDKNNRCPKNIIVLMSFVPACLVILLCYIRILVVVRKSGLKARAQTPRVQLDSITNKSKRNTVTSCEAAITSNTDVSDSVENDKTHERLQKMAQLSFTNVNNTKKKMLPSKKDKKLRTMVLTIIICKFIYVPVIFIKLINKEVTTYPSFNIFGYILMFVTPCIHPVLYVFMSREYRQAYKYMIKWK